MLRKKNINHNGIYFFQAPGSIVDGKWVEAKPHWDNGNEKNSQSRKLYKRLEEVLDDFFEGTSINWRTTPEVTIDIVAHSQGGLVVREMLRGLVADSASAGSDNPANHIGRLVTVDTPHLGAATAAEDSKTINNVYSGLGNLIDDLNAIVSGKPNNHLLINASAGLDYSNPLSWLAIPVSTMLGSIGSFLLLSDYNVQMNGPYMGPYKISLNIDPLGPSFDDGSCDAVIDPLKEYREMAIDTRKKGEHLFKEGSFIRSLNYGQNGESYPRKPNDKRLNILPLYSGDTSPIVFKLLDKIKNGLRIVCPQLNDDKKVACVSLETFLEDAVEDETHGLFKLDVGFDETLLKTLNSLIEEWLKNSDMIVEEVSQRYQDEVLGVSHAQIPELEEARSYVFHDALDPFETVSHMRLGDIDGVAASARQGLDIVCALDFYCNEMFTKKTDAKLIYLKNGAVDMVGNLDMAPVYLGKGKQGSRLTDGVNYLEAMYEPGVGSYVNYIDDNGQPKTEMILQANVATNPRLQRKGSVVSALFNNPSGKIFKKDYDMPKLSSQTTFSVVAEDGVPLPIVVAGIGDVRDETSQKPPESSKNWEKEKKIFVMHREARDKHEKNVSRPRILVANASDEDIVGFKIAYYFTADPAKLPEVDVDYPNIPVIRENLGGDQWRFVLDASDSVLKAKSVFPNLDGWQIRVHYHEWEDYIYLNDWSANYNVGVPRVNKNIVVYDADGHILWGEEPELFKSVDDGLIASPKGTLFWYDSAPWDKNMFKPQVSIKNTGTLALKDYHAKLWFRVPEGKELYIPSYDWYTPVSRPVLNNVGENVWELDLYFDRYMLYPEESVVEGNVGLRLLDWSSFDKTVCGIALVDSEDNVIFGSVPSVEKCKSYDAPSLLETQYVWGF